MFHIVKLEMRYSRTELGLRERKKMRMRRAISDVATRLFTERGFEKVTVAEVAEAAEVSLSTVFNYFPTKEDLVFDRQEEVEEGWAEVVRDRMPGESAVAALRRDYLKKLREGDPRSGLAEGLASFYRLVEASPSLRAREWEIGERAEAALCRALTEEAGVASDDLTPRVVAGMAAGVYRGLYAESRQRLLDGQRVEEVRPVLLEAARRAFDLLEGGVGGYCTRDG
jgi:AcrR family transcriptional regulator